MSHRRASHAGSWYNADRATLSRELTRWLAEAQKTRPSARAIIAPHAGYSYSGPAAAWAYKHIEQSGIRRVFLLGPSHHVYTPRCSVSACTEYCTPLGNLAIDAEMSAALRATGKFDVMERRTDEDEHSLEMHLPYIFQVMQGQPFKLVPVLVGALSEASEAEYGKLFAEHLANPENIFVISSDFCHWGKRFRFTPWNKQHGAIYQSIEVLDREGMRLIEAQDAAGFAAYQRQHGNTICGQHPIAVLLHALQSCTAQHQEPLLRASRTLPPRFPVNQRYAAPCTCARSERLIRRTARGQPSQLVCLAASPQVQFVHYAQSSQCQNVEDSSVSYASAIISAG